MHCLLREPQVARRGAMRSPVRLRRLLGQDEGVPSMPRSRADVDAGTCGVMSANVKALHSTRLDVAFFLGVVLSIAFFFRGRFLLPSLRRRSLLRLEKPEDSFHHTYGVVHRYGIRDPPLPWRELPCAPCTHERGHVRHCGACGQRPVFLGSLGSRPLTCSRACPSSRQS